MHTVYLGFSSCEDNRLNAQRGNAMFLILIVVALFAALSYAVTQSSRGAGTITKEQVLIDTAVSQLCTAHIEQAVMRLGIVSGCSTAQISYELSDGTNPNPAAPVDKHCHVFDPAGAGETPCGVYLVDTGGSFCSLAAAGDLCPEGGGIVYVSDNLGPRLYTTVADQGLISNNGPADAACTGLGAGWHLPDLNELNELYLARNTGALSGTFDLTGAWPFGYYWSSVDFDAANEWDIDFSTGVAYANSNAGALPVRCVK